MSSETGSLADEYPIKRGAVLGATASLGILLIGFVFGGLSVGGGVVAYYLMHLWPLLLGGGSGTGLVLLFSVVPVGVLLVSGYQLASETGGHLGGFKTGATVTVGYALPGLVALGALYGGAGVRSIEMALAAVLIKENVILAFLFTGLVVPAVFGGLGGVVAESRGG